MLPYRQISEVFLWKMLFGVGYSYKLMNFYDLIGLFCNCYYRHCAFLPISDVKMRLLIGIMLFMSECQLVYHPEHSFHIRKYRCFDNQITIDNRSLSCYHSHKETLIIKIYQGELKENDYVKNYCWQYMWYI